MIHITLDELLILNMALDRRDFWGVPSLRSRTMPSLFSEKVYKSLIEKGLLSDKDTLTKEGAMCVKRMEDYKNSLKYIKIGALTIGLYQKDFGIALMENPVDKTYSFARMNMKFENLALNKMYAFLDKENEKEPVLNGSMQFDTLQEKVDFKLDNAIFLATLDMKKAASDIKSAIINEVLFYYEGHHYRYDRNKELIYPCSKEDVWTHLREGMVLS